MAKKLLNDIPHPGPHIVNILKILEANKDSFPYHELRSLPTPGRFFFPKIDFFHFLIFCSTSYYKQNNTK